METTAAILCVRGGTSLFPRNGKFDGGACAAFPAGDTSVALHPDDRDAEADSSWQRRRKEYRGTLANDGGALSAPGDLSLAGADYRSPSLPSLLVAGWQAACLCSLTGCQ